VDDRGFTWSFDTSTRQIGRVVRPKGVHGAWGRLDDLQSRCDGEKRYRRQSSSMIQAPGFRRAICLSLLSILIARSSIIIGVTCRNDNVSVGTMSIAGLAGIHIALPVSHSHDSRGCLVSGRRIRGSDSLLRLA
jgi:hypothetical protein